MGLGLGLELELELELGFGSPRRGRSESSWGLFGFFPGEGLLLRRGCLANQACDP